MMCRSSSKPSTHKVGLQLLQVSAHLKFDPGLGSFSFGLHVFKDLSPLPTFHAEGAPHQAKPGVSPSGSPDKSTETNVIPQSKVPLCSLQSQGPHPGEVGVRKAEGNAGPKHHKVLRLSATFLLIKYSRDCSKLQTIFCSDKVDPNSVFLLLQCVCEGTALGAPLPLHLLAPSSAFSQTASCSSQLPSQRP